MFEQCFNYVSTMFYHCFNARFATYDVVCFGVMRATPTIAVGMLLFGSIVFG